MSQAIGTLYADGGWTRYYQGLTAALVQGPVSRFGDTFANAGILALLDSNPYLKNMWSVFKTVFASLAAALFRMILTPIDTVKTTLQTQGKPGMQILRTRVRSSIRFGISSLNVRLGKNVRHWFALVWCICHRSRYIRRALSCKHDSSF